MQRFAGIFFQMRARQINGFFFIANKKADFAAHDDRNFKLGNLVVFRQIGVKIVFACKDGAGRYRAADCQAEADGAIYGAAVHDRQAAGQGQINAVGLGVGRRAKGRAAARKNFRLGR